MENEWKETVLWTRLKKCDKSDSPEVRTLLMSWMPQIEKVLASGGTSPTDFTLHDAQHSWRVAQRMAEIMPATTLTELGPYDLAFLLLSAFLHDIGMTPEQR